jgi:hypothetical protein
MKNSLYSGMLNDLSKVNMSAFARAQAELHMARAAAIMGMVMGSNKARSADAKVEVAAKPEEYRAAA